VRWNKIFKTKDKDERKEKKRKEKKRKEKKRKEKKGGKTNHKKLLPSK